MSGKFILPDHIIGKVGGAQESLHAVLSDVPLVAIYFSAHWCPPCKQFTPQLARFYRDVNQHEKKMEVIFVSSDQSEAEFNSYYDSMPWKAVPYNQVDHVNQAYPDLQGIPTLRVFDAKSGSMISMKGVQDVIAAISSRSEVAQVDKWIESARSASAGSAGSAPAPQPVPTAPKLDSWQRGIKLEIEETVANHEIVIYSKTWCPFCEQAKALLPRLSQDVKVVELDKVPMGDQLHDVLKMMIGQTSVPAIYAGGKFIGGFTDAQKKVTDGTLLALLSQSNGGGGGGGGSGGKKTMSHKDDKMGPREPYHPSSPLMFASTSKSSVTTRLLVRSVRTQQSSAHIAASALSGRASLQERSTVGQPTYHGGALLTAVFLMAVLPIAGLATALKSRHRSRK